jgi:hypothetical protein
LATYQSRQGAPVCAQVRDRLRSNLTATLTAATVAVGYAALPLQYFGDLECPSAGTSRSRRCPRSSRDGCDQANRRIEYPALEAATREPEVFLAQQVAALAAGKQDKAWEFIRDTRGRRLPSTLVSRHTGTRL